MAETRRRNRSKGLTRWEKALKEVNERVDSLESRASALDGYPDVEAATPASPKRSGPRPRIDDDELFERRDSYVLGVESVWSELEPPTVGLSHAAIWISEKRQATEISFKENQGHPSSE